MPLHKVEVAITRHHLECAVDGDWHHRQLQLICQQESSTFIFAHLACPRAASLWEHHHRHAVFQCVTSLIDALLYLLRITVVNEYKPCRLACLADERGITQRGFHHPFEVASEESVGQEDVERSLMVWTEDITLTIDNLLAPLDCHRQKKQANKQPRPPFSWVIAPDTLSTEGAAHDGDDGGDECSQQSHWQYKQQLVCSINKAFQILIKELKFITSSRIVVSLLGSSHGAGRSLPTGHRR